MSLGCIAVSTGRSGRVRRPSASLPPCARSATTTRLRRRQRLERWSDDIADAAHSLLCMNNVNPLVAFSACNCSGYVKFCRADNATVGGSEHEAALIRSTDIVSGATNLRVDFGLQSSSFRNRCGAESHPTAVALSSCDVWHEGSPQPRGAQTNPHQRNRDWLSLSLCAPRVSLKSRSTASGFLVECRPGCLLWSHALDRNATADKDHTMR